MPQAHIKAMSGAIFIFAFLLVQVLLVIENA